MSNNRNYVLKENMDIIYLITAVIIFLLDVFTTSEMFEALAFVLIVVGFIFSVLPNKSNKDDERVSYLKLYSGYIGFMFTTIIICVITFLHRYAEISMSLTDILRYIMLFMYFIFSLAYAISKRKM